LEVIEIFNLEQNYLIMLPFYRSFKFVKSYVDKHQKYLGKSFCSTCAECSKKIIVTGTVKLFNSVFDYYPNDNLLLNYFFKAIGPRFSLDINKEFYEFYELIIKLIDISNNTYYMAFVRKIFDQTINNDFIVIKRIIDIFTKKDKLDYLANIYSNHLIYNLLWYTIEKECQNEKFLSVILKLISYPTIYLDNYSISNSSELYQNKINDTLYIKKNNIKLRIKDFDQ
jgi:hypothetical protein